MYIIVISVNNVCAAALPSFPVLPAAGSQYPQCNPRPSLSALLPQHRLKGVFPCHSIFSALILKA